MTLIITIIKGILNLIYSFMKLSPTKDKLVFISRQANSPSLDIQMLEEKIKEMHPQWKTVILCKKLEGGLGKKISYCFHMLSQMHHMATSRVVILDSYCIAASILKHKDSLLIIQMWHSVGTMKKFGHSILDKPEGSSSKIAKAMNMHKGYDYALASGEAYKDHLAEGFNIDKDIIKTFPLPRVERLQDEKYTRNKRTEIFTFHPEMTIKKNIIYVPTFRKNEDEEFDTALNDLIDQIDFDKYNLVVKAHPLANFNSQDKRVIVDNAFTSMDMLFAADMVVSDFSCIIYEAAVLKKPIYMYTYDYDHYMDTRDIYMDYKNEMPGPICNNATDLIRAIESNNYDFEKLQNFLDKYVVTSGHETQDIVDFIWSKLK